MAELDPKAPWESAHNSEAYARFCEKNALYRASSDSLVDILTPASDAHVLDIGCGTGTTTCAVLDRLGPEGRVTAIDASASQIALARECVRDDRVSFVHVPRDDPATGVEGHFDGAISSAAFWQVPLEPTVALVAARLRSGGKLVVNMFPDSLPRVTAGVDPPLRAPARCDADRPPLEQLMLEAARSRFGYERPERDPRDSEAYESRFLAVLDRAGFVLERAGCREITRTPEETRAWYAIPIFRRNVVPGLSIENGEVVLQEAFSRWKPSGNLRTIWLELAFVRDGAD